MIIGVLGISGSGKDTIINRYLERFPGQKVHGTKVMMKGLGFEDIDIWDGKPIPDEYYQRSEDTDYDNKNRIIDTYVYDFYKDLKSKSDIYFVTLHLVVPKRAGDEIIYQTDLLRSWFEDIFDRFVYIHSDSQKIVERKVKDINTHSRDRGNTTVTFESTDMQNKIGAEEWAKFKSRIQNKIPFIEIENDDLGLSVREFMAFIK